MIDETYQDEYMNFIQEFNKLLSKKEVVDWSKVSNEISKFCMLRNAELPEKGEKWCSPYFVQWEHAICILAHSKQPIRCLAVFDIREGTFQRLELKHKKGLNGGLRLCRANNSLGLAGTKRGFWCAHVGTAQLKIDMAMVEGNKEVEEQMIALYNKYVADMDIDPFKSQDGSVAYKQQFDMTKYPNASWKAAVANVREKKPKALGKRAVLTHSNDRILKRPCDWVQTNDIPSYAEGVLVNPTSKITKEKMNSLLNKKMPSDKIFIQDELDKLEREDRMDFTKSCDLSDAFLCDNIPPPPPLEFILNIED